jgi:multiubiquitin
MGKIHVFVNRVKIDLAAPELTGREILAAAGIGEDHDLFLLQGEGDPSGGRPVGLDERVKVKNGDHFRAIPGNRNFG